MMLHVSCKTSRSYHLLTCDSGCADGTGLTPAAVKGIIAACVIGFVLLLALLWFAVDMVHSPRKVSMEPYAA